MNFIRPIGSAPNMGMEGNSGKIGLGGVAYSVNMQVVGVFRGRKLSLATLTVAVAAQNVTLVKVGGKNLILGAATYSVGGQAVTMWKSWRIGTAGAVVAVRSGRACNGCAPGTPYRQAPPGPLQPHCSRRPMEARRPQARATAMPASTK